MKIDFNHFPVLARSDGRKILFEQCDGNVRRYSSSRRTVNP